MTGLDISSHNGKLDFQKLKNAGCQFLYIRGGWWDEVDKLAHYNLDAAYAFDIPCGIYWFSYAHGKSEAEKEAAAALSLASLHHCPLGIAYDFEEEGMSYNVQRGKIYSVYDTRDQVKGFCDAVEKEGYFALNYGGIYFSTKWYGPEIWKRYAHWLANPSNLPTIIPYWVKQSSFNYLVPEISTPFDKNEMEISKYNLMLKFKKGGY